MKFILGFLVILTVFAFAIALGANNDQTVTFHYLLAQVECRLSTLLAIILGIGFVLGWLITGLFYLRVKLQFIAMKSRFNKLQKKYNTEVQAHQKKQLTNSVDIIE